MHELWWPEYMSRYTGWSIAPVTVHLMWGSWGSDSDHISNDPYWVTVYSCFNNLHLFLCLKIYCFLPPELVIVLTWCLLYSHLQVHHTSSKTLTPVHSKSWPTRVRLLYSPYCGGNHFSLYGTLQTIIRLNSQPISQATIEHENTSISK